MSARTNVKMPVVAGMAIWLGAIGLSFAGCDQSVGDAQEDLAETTYEAKEDVIEEEADLQEALGNDTASEVLDERADAMGEAADEMD
ncbi:MAG: hypothetical protein NXH71_03735 [Erythrobacteraceae bacterium]|jgi:ABC-type uncharacterized transport system permease subunit|nr:hypothetical protein [Erythrobacteraceae bacterium]